jgi:hypothetical protein
MSGPLDAITAFHNAFRKDMAVIDAAALAGAIGDPGQVTIVERFRFFNEILAWHAAGEELAIFPALEAVAPSVAEAYIMDHRGLDRAYTALDDAVSARDPLGTARATASFKFHLDIHLAKEDAHLYRLIAERVSVADQGKAVGLLSTAVPQDRFPEVIAWLFPLLDSQDRERTVRVWQMLMPAQVFAGAAALVRKTVGDDWDDLIRRIPELAS